MLDFSIQEMLMSRNRFVESSNAETGKRSGLIESSRAQVARCLSEKSAQHYSVRFGLLVVAVLALGVFLPGARVTGSGGRSADLARDQREYIQPVPSLIDSGFTRDRGATRSTVDLPSKRYAVVVNSLGISYELGSVEPSAMSNLQ